MDGHRPDDAERLLQVGAKPAQEGIAVDDDVVTDQLEAVMDASEYADLLDGAVRASGQPGR